MSDGQTRLQKCAISDNVLIAQVFGQPSFGKGHVWIAQSVHLDGRSCTGIDRAVHIFLEAYGSIVLLWFRAKLSLEHVLEEAKIAVLGTTPFLNIVPMPNRYAR